MPPDGPGRPQRYCRRSHRQRAYESRKLAVGRGLEHGEVLLSASDWHASRDARYLLEAAARDAETDLRDQPANRELRSIVENLIDSVDHLMSVTPEPKAISDG
jgi:hypothetical protein